MEFATQSVLRGNFRSLDLLDCEFAVGVGRICVERGQRLHIGMNRYCAYQKNRTRVRLGHVSAVQPSLERQLLSQRYCAYACV